jgi:hypothetical protein
MGFARGDRPRYSVPVHLAVTAELMRHSEVTEPQAGSGHALARAWITRLNVPTSWCLRGRQQEEGEIEFRGTAPLSRSGFWSKVHEKRTELQGCLPTQWVLNGYYDC